MRTEFRVAVADDERDTREFIGKCLERFGHHVVGVCQSSDELLKTIKERNPDLVISDIRMPQVDGIEAAIVANRERPIPFLLVSAHHDQETLNRAAGAHVVGYLTKPISETDLKTAVAMSMVRFDQFQTLLKDNQNLRQSLEDRKLIERGKGIVVRRMSLDEEEAYRRIRRWASNQNVKVSEICRRILAAEEVFQSLEQI